MRDKIMQCANFLLGGKHNDGGFEAIWSITSHMSDRNDG